MLDSLSVCHTRPLLHSSHHGSWCSHSYSPPTNALKELAQMVSNLSSKLTRLFLHSSFFHLFVFICQILLSTLLFHWGYILSGSHRLSTKRHKTLNYKLSLLSFSLHVLFNWPLLEIILYSPHPKSTMLSSANNDSWCNPVLYLCKARSFVASSQQRWTFKSTLMREL